MKDTNLIKPYEISIWGTRPAALPEDLTIYSDNFEVKGEIVQSEQFYSDENVFKVLNLEAVNTYYDEYKIAVIGSDKMSNLSRACEPFFERKTTGEKTLTFTLYTKYWDTDACDFIDNPFVKLLSNERIVKLKYED